MTPEQLALVADTVPRVTSDGDRFSARFYDRLFELEPETRALFPSDLTEQRGKLVDELSFLAGAVEDLPAFIESARRLGARHHRYGVKPEHFPLVEQALLAALSDVLSDGFTAEVEAAWRRLYRLIAETMLEGAAGQMFASSPDPGSRSPSQ